MPIETFVTTLIHWTFFLMTRTKLAFVGFVAAGNSMWHQVLDDAKVMAHCHRSVRNDMRLFLRTRQYPVQIRTTKFWKVLPQYYSVLQSTTPVLLCTTKYYSRNYYSSTTKYYSRKYYSSTTPYYKLLLQYYFVLQSTTPVLLRTTKY